MKDKLDIPKLDIRPNKIITRSGTNCDLHNILGFLSGVFQRRLNPNCKSIILDGELMGWNKEKKVFGSKGMSFDVKKLSENSHHQPCFVAFDIIMYNDELLVNKTYEERLRFLKDAFAEEDGCLMLSKSKQISTKQELCEIFNESMKNKEEGIVLKRCDVTYKPNVRDGSGCFKIKAEYSDNLVEDVDLIILGGYYGEGKRMGFVGSFLMGVADPPIVPGDNPSNFVSVVSVSNGFSEKDLEDLKKRFEGRWLQACPENVSPPRLNPPTLWISPEDSIILTIRATELTRSKDYPAGYSLRFPRVTNIKYDKPWYTACTTTELLQLIKDAGPIQKLTKREINYEDLDDTPDVKIPRRSRPRAIKVEQNIAKTSKFDTSPLVLYSRLFDGKEICVINGDDEFSKEQIEQILLQHGAKIVQNELKRNYCVIIGNVKTARANSVIQRQMYDVVTLNWFKRVTKEENWSSLQDFLPWDLLSSRESTKHRLAKIYDEYYDSFITDADETSLNRSFNKAEEKVNTVELNPAQVKSIDEELFGNKISPYSIFRDIVGYFSNPSDCTNFEFRFMAGTVKKMIDHSVTHVFIDENFITSELKNISESGLPNSLKVIKSSWIEDCFRSNRIVSDEKYLVPLNTDLCV